MIKLRTHIISLTAVFLALGIGLVLGSTFLDRTFVDALDAQVQRLNDRVDERSAEVDSLSRVIEEQTLTFAVARESGYEQLLADVLGEVEVVVVADGGVDENQVDTTVEMVQAAGAEVPSVLWLTDRWNPTDLKASVEVAEVLGLDASDDPERVTSEAADLFASALAGPVPTNTPGDPAAGTTQPSETTSTTDPDEPTTAAPTTGADPETDQPETPGSVTTDPATDATSATAAVLEPQAMLELLEEAGLIEPEAALSGDVAAPSPEALIVYITGEGSALDPTEAYLPVASALADTNPARVLLAEAMTTRGLREMAIDDDVPARGVALQPIRDDESLNGQVSTLDGLSSPLGKLAAVAALVELGDGKTGNYGLAKGVDAVLPEVGG